MTIQIESVVEAANTPGAKRYHLTAGITHLMDTDDFFEASRVALQPAWNGGPFPAVWDRVKGDFVPNSELCY